MTLFGKNVKVRKLKYKSKIYLGLFSLALVIVIIFILYNFYDFKRSAIESTEREAAYTATRVVGQVDERLENLWQYYLYSVAEDNVLWMMENSVDYSDYNRYHSSQELLANTSIFGDYINGYGLVNFRTSWILSNKGMYKIGDAVNKDELVELFENNNDIIDKNYWYYNFEKSNIKLISREYPRLVDTDGLNIVVKLPNHTSRVYGMLVVNINMNTWQNWIKNVIDDCENVVVVDLDGNVIYATDDKYVDACVNHLSTGTWLYESDNRRDSQCMSVAESSILGWNYYVIRNMSSDTYFASKLNTAVIIVIVIMIMGVFAGLAYMLYQPVDSLVKNISEEDLDYKGNEIDYLKDKFKGIKYDKEMLQNTVSENRVKIQELFELRLIRGEVRSDDEWNEYYKGLQIEPCKYFAAAVMVLNLRGDFETADNISEDSVCIRLVEETPEALKKLTWMPLVYNACTMFCIFGDDDENKMLDKIMEFYEGIQSFAKERFGLRILMGISATHTEHRHIYAAYRESINALTMGGDSDNPDANDDYRFYLNTMTGRSVNFNVSYEKDVQAALKAVDKEQCYHVIDAFSEYLRTQATIDDTVYLIVRMINSILDAASNTNLELSVVFPEGLRKLYRNAIEAGEPSRVRRYLKYALIDPILLARNEKLEKGSTVIMEQIEAKIVETSGNITLAECADALNVHQTYIWKILKMERGKTFSEFVEEYKLEEAKRMLLDTSLSVNEIAEKLGYTNAQNFIRFFSKGTGLTPGKFRKLY